MSGKASVLHRPTYLWFENNTGFCHRPLLPNVLQHVRAYDISGRAVPSTGCGCCLVTGKRGPPGDRDKRGLSVPRFTGLIFRGISSEIRKDDLTKSLKVGGFDFEISLRLRGFTSLKQ
ncbi:hypothetical protein chiPu_0005091 [Chiloscyllium punctatum]|uniref:Uncharacterized protein n=1 Tax=Chiloscyllium punctatum TaxID=137246 RepID=A0A401S8F9_CHIPU|nr:hypothetical protein [Chiloscyllium punctatum]